MSSPSSPKSNYSEMFTNWGFQFIGFFASSPEKLQTQGKDFENLLSGFSYSSENVTGEVDAEVVKKIVMHAMEPVKTFYRAGVLLTLGSFFASRLVSFFPIVPSLLMIVGIASALFTWDASNALTVMERTYLHFDNVSLRDDTNVSWCEFVRTIDKFSHEVLATTRFIGADRNVKKTLTNMGPHLTRQVQNAASESKVSPWEIVAEEGPLLAIIYKVTAAFQKPESKDE